MKKPKEHKLAETISVVSHQFKTPLSIVKGYLEVLLAEDLGKINSEQREYLNNILESANHLIDLVKDLLDVSRIEQGKLELAPKSSDLEEIAKNVIKEAYPFARANNCEIVLEVESQVPKLKIDPLKIGQVISNFISNAISYTKGKSKRVVRVILKKEGSEVMLCCRDNGIGISDKEKKDIFNKFYRGEEALTLSTSGSGLGLFISRAIIKKSGGKI